MKRVILLRVLIGVFVAVAFAVGFEQIYWPLFRHWELWRHPNVEALVGPLICIGIGAIVVWVLLPFWLNRQQISAGKIVAVLLLFPILWGFYFLVFNLLTIKV